MKPVVWIAEDDHSVRFVLTTALRDAGYQVHAFDTGDAALAALADGAPDVLLTDVRMPGNDGLALLRQWHEVKATAPVIVMSAFTDVTTTAAAYRLGAVEYIAKPFDLDQVLEVVRRVLADARPMKAVATEKVRTEPALIGQSPAMHEVFRLIGRIAASDLNVLVIGETGTGKELAARALHEESVRRDNPFVALNTAAIPAELLESEMFGHEAGAFTGARQRHIGRFEQAEGGTLFLDEIGDMPLALQTRLLRVLAGGEFYRVGGRSLIRSDVRIVAATHQDLKAAVAEGRFRADLLHRLDVVRITLPPLRQRQQDIPVLAQHFLMAAAQMLDVPPKRFSRAALDMLERYDFPGNVRELENLCRRVAVMAPGHEVQAVDLGLASPIRTPEVQADWTEALRAWAESELAANRDQLYRRASEDMERTLIDVVMRHVDGHRQRAARLLGLGRNTLTRKLAAWQDGKSK
ncbi:MAG TPA: nitrogen regulation protein NR(I) [Oleiagrimonas sp.]|nr:nitrogen regulation protein NR(I) [Oleiagrimonas sp.]